LDENLAAPPGELDEAAKVSPLAEDADNENNDENEDDDA
jgi:hypothetical protein